jgi:hypothetical protein
MFEWIKVMNPSMNFFYKVSVQFVQWFWGEMLTDDGHQVKFGPTKMSWKTPTVVPLIRPLPPKVIFLARPDFRCTEIVKYYYIVSLKRGHPSYQAIFSMQIGWPYNWGTNVVASLPTIKSETKTQKATSRASFQNLCLKVVYFLLLFLISSKYNISNEKWWEM